MVSIVANDPKIENAIQSLLDTLINAGSGFHSKLVIHEEGGGLSLETTEPMERGKEIIRLPRTVLMPGDQYGLDISGSDFVVEYPEHSIATDLQRRIIDKMYEIYNLTNKIKLHEEYSFLLSLENTPSLIEKLGEGRQFITGPYEEWMSWIKTGMTSDQRKSLICDTYVKTRPLGYSDPVRESSVNMIMPILDFMNHNWEGGAFSVGQGVTRKGDLTMQSSQPFKDSLQCYANYGIMDAFDTLVRYDFVDKSAPILRSVAVDIDGPAGNGETIQIKNKIGVFCKKELSKEMQDLRRHIPDFSFEGDQMIVSHILLPLDTSKFALVRVLNMILAAYHKHHSTTFNEEKAKVWRIRAQETIIEKNKAYYKDLLSFIEALPQEQRESFGVARVKDLAQYQLQKVDDYKIQQ